MTLDDSQRWMLFTALAIFLLGSTLHASETDQRIKNDIEESFVFKTLLKNDSVRVEALEGVVTLAGTVEHDAHKTLAQETAGNFPGVVRVDNRVELKGEHPAENSNEWISMKVTTMLLSHRNVNPLQTNVYVEEGIVTLRGQTSSLAQKDLLTEYVMNMSGIEGVRNEMTVAPHENPSGKDNENRIDDASITAQTKMALSLHRSTKSLNAGVMTSNGVVTLTGKTANTAEKDLVTELVSDIRGVLSVINKMTI